MVVTKVKIVYNDKFETENSLVKFIYNGNVNKYTLNIYENNKKKVTKKIKSKKELFKKIPSRSMYLNCINNNLTSLPDKFNLLVELNCSNNNLTSLPDNLPNNLKELYCYNNNLSRLPDNLSNSLETLGCNNNNLTSLPDNLPNSLKYLYYRNNPIYNFIEKHYNADWKKYKKYKKAVNIIGSWFLDCKYNPSYKYCKYRLNAEYDELYS